MLIMLKKKNKLIYNSIIKQGGLYQNKVNSSLISIHNCLHNQGWAAWVAGSGGGGGGRFWIVMECSPDLHFFSLNKGGRNVIYGRRSYDKH